MHNRNYFYNKAITDMYVQSLYIEIVPDNIDYIEYDFIDNDQ